MKESPIDIFFNIKNNLLECSTIKQLYFIFTYLLITVTPDVLYSEQKISSLNIGAIIKLAPLRALNLAIIIFHIHRPINYT